MNYIIAGLAVCSVILNLYQLNQARKYKGAKQWKQAWEGIIRDKINKNDRINQAVKDCK